MVKDNIPYLLALHSINGLGPIRLKALLDYFEDPKKVWEASVKELLQLGIPKNTASLLEETRRHLDPENYAQQISNSGIKWTTLFDENYPDLLKEIYGPPIVLYYLGYFKPEDKRAVAVVGTRKMTGYGRLVTEKLTAELVEAGVTIVSGLARGVDTQAHQTAIKKEGRTVAVLGGGLLKIFPPENTQLAKQIISGFGALVSEFPPDAPSLPGNFPTRNRIISGLSLAVLVTEAAQDSGSLITAKLALEQGREVFAVPGPITSELSSGPASLIKQGASLVTEAGEILEELGISKGKRVKGEGERGLKLNEVERRILETLASENKHVDEFCRELQLQASIVSASLIKMEIYGLVKNLGGGIYVKVC